MPVLEFANFDESLPHSEALMQVPSCVATKLLSEQLRQKSVESLHVLQELWHFWQDDDSRS